MKKKILFLMVPLISVFLLSEFTSMKQLQKKNEIKMLQIFYQEYFRSFNFSLKVGSSRQDSLRSLYCTDRLLEELNKFSDPEGNGWIDVDVFINAQDGDANSIKTLEIFADRIRHDLYHVSFRPFGDMKFPYDTINLVVVEENDNYKIDSVITSWYRL